MRIGRRAKLIQHSTMALVLAGVCPGGALARNRHAHKAIEETQRLTTAQATLLKTVWDSTERFKDVSVAEAEGCALLFGCVSGPDAGAMGLHFVKHEFGGTRRNRRHAPADRDLRTDARWPPAIDRCRLSGDCKRLGQSASGSRAPQLMGQLFHYFESPNRFGLPAFYMLHVWAWKENPNRAFVNWHPNVSCQSFSGQSSNAYATNECLGLAYTNSGIERLMVEFVFHR